MDVNHGFLLLTSLLCILWSVIGYHVDGMNSNKWMRCDNGSLFSVEAQDIGVVRCYVCKSNVFASTPVKDYAHCPDLYNSSTTTIKYCRACYKYTGSLMVRYNQSMDKVVSRGCFDENAYMYSSDPNSTKGIFQTSGLLEPSGGTGAYAVKDNMVVSGKISGIRGGFLSYGPGDLFVCNDKDVCNNGQKLLFSFAALLPLISLIFHYY